MLVSVHPKLPMRDKAMTKKYYVTLLGFDLIQDDYEEYLIVEKDSVQLHFFLFKELDLFENYGQVYIRVDHIDIWYQQVIDRKVAIHPNGKLQIKPWGQKEFSLLDFDHNCLTFGQSVI